jgi:hypothetical protein
MQSILSGEGFEKWLKAQQSTKKPFSPQCPAMDILRRFVHQDEPVVEGTTFFYIAEYFKGTCHERLPIACADFGYTRKELDQLAKDGKTAKDVAKEIIERPQPDAGTTV